MQKNNGMKLVVLMLMVVVIAAGLSACSGKNGNDSKTRIIKDGAGREVKVPNKVKRVVCVGVGSLRYTSYMDAADLVVGVEDYEKKDKTTALPYNYVNHSKFEKLPVTGTNGIPNTEAIVKVNPQVIVLSSFASVNADELSEKTGIPVVVIPGSDTTLDKKAYKTIEIMGKLYGKEDRANELKEYFDDVKKDLKDRTKGIKNKNKPLVYVGGVSFKGHHGFEGTEALYGPLELIRANNLANTTGQKGAFNMDIEKVVAADPDIIFLDFNGIQIIKQQYRQNKGLYDSLKAVKKGKIFSQISFRYCATNLETSIADSYYAGCKVFPKEFKGVDYEKKAREAFKKLLGKDIYDDMKEEGYEFRSLKLGE